MRYNNNEYEEYQIIAELFGTEEQQNIIYVCKGMPAMYDNAYEAVRTFINNHQTDMETLESNTDSLKLLVALQLMPNLFEICLTMREGLGIRQDVLWSIERNIAQIIDCAEERGLRIEHHEEEEK